MKRCLSAIVCSILVLGITWNTPQVKGENMPIEKGSKVSFDYTLTVEGQVVDSSQQRGPLEYVHGEGNIISGLADEMEGLTQGDEKRIVLAPEDGYGEVNPEAFREIPRAQLPEGAEPQVGMMLQMQTPDGQVFPVGISEVKDDTVVVNMNHPLAGQTLTFDVKVTSVE